MSSKKSKLDLLVRVRYSNPLPPPPFPPKLLHIPTDPARYANIEFTANLANEALLPMVVDAECGMPLDLGKWEGLWQGDDNDPGLNPDPHTLPELDPKDEYLVAELGPYSNGLSTSSSFNGPPSTATSSTVNVSWLRKTEYISREGTQRAANISEKPAYDAPIDVSRTAQIRDIEASFDACQSLDLSKLKHPSNPRLTAVEVFDILPDAEIWANEYDLFKFAERPGERLLDQPDSRLDCAILRPMESDGDHFLAYYLTKEDAEAEEFKSRRRVSLPPLDDEDSSATVFHFVRDYETVKIEPEVLNEFLIVLDDGSLSTPTGPPRPKGAYYKNIERRITLRKKRQNKMETVAYTDKWDMINLEHAPFGPEEEEERNETLAEVLDPAFMYSRMDIDADGEAEDEIIGAGGEGGAHESHGAGDVEIGDN
ncbi:hypothetical protein BOTBODRAFT_175885 [Botryobasidium botryosum FD-172 SS1]|uniref:RNA polymerase II-associated protein n=1 Tax=Botryobasidium botryosum (strain FD-172 SS1) TaxID=930990 RepID=A0A067MB60_BOTB1|nr:hypothetical protein BOTBODRAFT_175885 [Botryobasidium botryosum FD-172 SS1]